MNMTESMKKTSKNLKELKENIMENDNVEAFETKVVS